MDRDATAILLGHEKWKEMLNSSLVAGDRITTPLRELITVMPGNLGTVSSSDEIRNASTDNVQSPDGIWGYDLVGA